VILRAIHHIGLVAEDARLCEIEPMSLGDVVPVLGLLARQVVAQRPSFSKPCQICLAAFWLAQEAEEAH
jgi:hypothetical protein